MPPYERLQKRIEELIAQGCEYDEALQEALREIDNLDEILGEMLTIQQTNEWDLTNDDD